MRRSRRLDDTQLIEERIRRLNPSGWFSWLTLDSLSKTAAIITPLILAAGGWYFADIWKAREDSIKVYEKTASAIGALSVADVAKQRDVLFSIIQLDQPELVRRVASYIAARIEYEANASEYAIRFRPVDAKVTSSEVAALKLKYTTITKEIFLPLIIGAINAHDIEVAKTLLDAVPSASRFDRIIVGENKRSNVGELWSLLDFAVAANSEEMTQHLLARRIEPRAWTLKTAIDVGNKAIFESVAKATAREYGVSFPVWQHAATNATPVQINYLAGLGFASAGIGTAIGSKPTVVVAAKAFRYQNVEALFSAGFSAFSAAIDQGEDVMGSVADAFFAERASFGPRSQNDQVAKTIHALCKQYLKENSNFRKLSSELELIGIDRLKSEDSRRRVLRTVLETGSPEIVQCLAEFYEFQSLSSEQRGELLFDIANGASESARSLFERHAFPIDPSTYRGETLIMRAANRGDIALLQYLASRGANGKALDKSGEGIWTYAIRSNFNEIRTQRDALFGVQVKEFEALTTTIAGVVGIEIADGKGRTALHIAVSNANPEKIKAVLRRNPKLDEVTKLGETALSLAAEKPEIYLYLYGHGARAAGKIRSCTTAQQLLQHVANRFSDEDGAKPSDLVNAAARECR